MCEQCKRYGINREFETVFHSGPGYLPAPSQQEWSGYISKLRQYTSPFFSWLGGSKTPAAAPVTIPPPATPAPQTSSSSNVEHRSVQQAIAAGNRQEGSLTDKVFYARHPELGGKPLSAGMPGFSALSSEWVSIRDQIVRPLLAQSASAPSPAGTANSPGLQAILNAMGKKGYVVYTQPYQLNIVGVRAANAQANSFDDTINVFYKDNFGNWQYKSNAATTDPGTYYLNNPMNVSGTAIVVPGQYINSHKIGLHRSSYTALVQQGPLKVIRDTNKDNTLDFGSTNIITGVYGINIHKAGSNSTEVGQWSAGCQVFARSSDFDAFIRLCQQHSGLYGNNFTYTLLEEKDLR